MYKILYSYLLVLWASSMMTPVYAQSCTCTQVFEQYVTWVEENYIGYVMEVRDGDSGPYEKRTTEYRRRAQLTTFSKCVLLVNEWLEFFDDPHMTAFHSRSDSLLAARGVPLTLGKRSLSEVKDRLQRPNNDPVEGIWRSGNRKLLIAEDPNLLGVFVVMVVEADSVLGGPGDVIARLDRDIERDVYRMRGAQPFADASQASLHRDALLHLGMTTWARDVSQSSLTNPINQSEPLHPMLRVLDDESVLITLPSHQPQYRAALDSLIAANRDVITRAPILLIDVRGNRGGSGDTARSLAPFYFSPELWANPPSNESGWVMASPYTKAVYRYLRRVMGGDEAHEWIRATVDSLEAAETGAIVRDRFDLADSFRPDSVNMATKFVGVLTDWINIRAVDAFLMEATASDRVILFGEATDSAIDYQSAFTVPINQPAECAAEGFLVVYPRNASSWMPEAPVNPTGFVPDVPLDESTDDWVRAAHEYLKTRLATN